MTEEPNYTYVRGVGWVIGPDLTINGHPCEFLDLRKDKSKEGIYRYQVWLVGVPDAYGDYNAYNYTDWVDNWMSRAWKALDLLQKNVSDYHASNRELLTRPGIKQRVIQTDNDDHYRFW